MRLLISNDDGIYSPGLALLASVARDSATCWLWRPMLSNRRPATRSRRPARSHTDARRSSRASTRSASTARRPTVSRWACTTRPDVDVVLSGVNLGTNLGNGMWHSGTLAAAHQAALLGARGIAFSTPVIGKDPDLTALAPYIRRVLDAAAAARRPAPGQREPPGTAARHLLGAPGGRDNTTARSSRPRIRTTVRCSGWRLPA